jgi:hypothetical protein
MGGHWSPPHAPLSKEATRGEMCQGEFVDLFNSLSNTLPPIGANKRPQCPLLCWWSSSHSFIGPKEMICFFDSVKIRQYCVPTTDGIVSDKKHVWPLRGHRRSAYYTICTTTPIHSSFKQLRNFIHSILETYFQWSTPNFRNQHTHYCQSTRTVHCNA